MAAAGGQAGHEAGAGRAAHTQQARPRQQGRRGAGRLSRGVRRLLKCWLRVSLSVCHLSDREHPPPGYLPLFRVPSFVAPLRRSHADHQARGPSMAIVAFPRLLAGRRAWRFCPHTAGLGPSPDRQDRAAAACSLAPLGRPYGATSASARARSLRCFPSPVHAAGVLGAVLLAQPCTVPLL